jgi:hypothetical protein
VAVGAREAGQAFAHGRVGLEAGDDLDHLHQRYRIEKVVTRKARRVLERGGDGGDRQRGGVADQHHVGGDHVFELLED